MPTLIDINVRNDARTLGDDGAPRTIRAHSEQVDLDKLTPRARALAEAITTTPHRPSAVVIETRRPAPPVRPEVLAAYGDAALGRTGPDGARQGTLTLTWLRADDPRTAATWLEERVQALPEGWYPVAAAVRPGDLHRPARVPSADDAAADRYLTRDQFIARLAQAGQPIGVQGWDTLRGTGHFPAPDFYTLDGKPLWLPETIDGYVARGHETWGVARVAEYLGFTGPSATGSARRQLSRWGIAPHGRGPGRGGESLYAADQVIAAHTHRPGSGNRTPRRASAGRA